MFGGVNMSFKYEPGIYRTSKYLPGFEAQIGPDQLVLIRTDGEFAPASVLLPVTNTNNQWRFQMPGVKIEFERLESMLEPLAWYQEPNREAAKAADPAIH